jgi:hypothetical protein
LSFEIQKNCYPLAFLLNFNSTYMAKFKTILIIFLVLGIITTLILFFTGAFKQQGAGIVVESTPVSLVFINGNQVGRTPYQATRDPGEITVKLVPENNPSEFTTFETKVTLISGIQTVIKREIGISDEVSAGEILSFEKTGGSDASLSMVSIPDAAKIFIDGNQRGFAPYKVNSISPGSHQLVFSASGYNDRTISLTALTGYQLTVVVKLAKNGDIQASPTPQPQTESSKIYIVILDTPNGFLRVRSEPATTGTEIARVKPGERYVVTQEDTQSGWTKIEYETGKEGWVSSQYVKKVEAVSPSPSPTPKPTPSVKP